MSFLKNHPFAVSAYFKRSTVLTFAVPKKRLEHLIPECVQLDTFQDKWAFVAIAMVQTEGLRPKGFPKFMGSNFFLIGYRIFVKYIDNRGKRLRGLYIIKSETDSQRMEIQGNIFTHYNYTTTDIKQVEKGPSRTIASEKCGFEITWQRFDGQAEAMPQGSPFTDWADARKFSGPLPFTFTYDKPSSKVLIVEGVRQNWKPQPIHVEQYRISFLQELGLPDAQLASAFVVEDTPYYWKKGRVEVWKP